MIKWTSEAMLDHYYLLVYICVASFEDIILHVISPCRLWGLHCKIYLKINVYPASFLLTFKLCFLLRGNVMSLRFLMVAYIDELDIHGSPIKWINCHFIPDCGKPKGMIAIWFWQGYMYNDCICSPLRSQRLNLTLIIDLLCFSLRKVTVECVRFRLRKYVLRRTFHSLIWCWTRVGSANSFQDYQMIYFHTYHFLI